MSRLAVVAAVVLGALLRAYPVQQPLVHPELQQALARHALLALARHDWRPAQLHHGSGFLYALRTFYTAWYACGRLSGAYHDRVDVLAAFAGDPFPFVVGARLLVLLYAVVALALTAVIGTRLGGRPAGAAAALFLAVSFVDVRGAHHVWHDVPASALILATVTAALAALERRTIAALVTTGALTGAAVATKHSVFLVVLPAALAAVFARDHALVRRLLATGIAAVGVYALLSPYTFLRFHDTLAALHIQSLVMHQPRPPRAQPLAVLVRCGLGWTAPGLALIGLAAALRRTPVAAAVVAAFPVAYALVLGTSTTLYLRYLVPLAPFVALFAAGGACALAKLALPRRPGLALFAVVLVAAAGPLCQSTTYDVVLARPDTRVLAGAWIRAHVAPGSGLVLPDVFGYPNPVLPLTELQLHLDYGEFAARLLQGRLAQSARVYQVSYVKPPFGPPPPEFHPPGRFVVAAYHPIVLPDTNMPSDYLRTLEALGARPVARFAGFAEPLPACAVFEPIDADYVPLRGAGAVERPGPNITIWEVPGRR